MIALVWGTGTALDSSHFKLLLAAEGFLQMLCAAAAAAPIPVVS